jgi:hypothetical protein
MAKVTRLPEKVASAKVEWGANEIRGLFEGRPRLTINF